MKKLIILPISFILIALIPVHIFPDILSSDILDSQKSSGLFVELYNSITGRGSNADFISLVIITFGISAFLFLLSLVFAEWLKHRIIGVFVEVLLVAIVIILGILYYLISHR